MDQPESDFVFRMKEDKYDGVQCALFEADGGAWKLHAMESIQEYLEEQLKGVDGFTQSFRRLTLFTEKGAGFCLLRYDERRSNDHIGRYGAERGKTHS